MTVQKLPSDGNKAETKRRYYWSLLEDKNALICKALDRYSNLNAMLGVFESERIIKNIRETHNLLLPVLKEAREIYPEYNNEIHVLRNILRDLTDNLAIAFGVDLYSET